MHHFVLETSMVCSPAQDRNKTQSKQKEHMQSPSGTSAITLAERLRVTFAGSAVAVVSGGLDVLYWLPLEIL